MGQCAESQGEVVANLDGGFDILGSHVFYTSGEFSAELTIVSRGKHGERFDVYSSRSREPRSVRLTIAAFDRRGISLYNSSSADWEYRFEFRRFHAKQ